MAMLKNKSASQRGAKISSKKRRAAYRKKYYRKNRKKILKKSAINYRRNRSKVRKRAAAYYRKNRKNVAKWGVIYRRKNRKEIEKRKVVWSRKNRKKILKQKLARYRKNRTKILKQKVAYHRKNRKKILKYMSVYSRTIGFRHDALVRRSKKLRARGIRGRVMTLAQHKAKLYYADGRERPCHYCGGENNKTGSGIDRKNSNVNYTNSNSVPSCRGCNTWKGVSKTYQQTMRHFKPMRDFTRKKGYK